MTGEHLSQLQRVVQSILHAVPGAAQNLKPVPSSGRDPASAPRQITDAQPTGGDRVSISPQAQAEGNRAIEAVFSRLASALTDSNPTANTQTAAPPTTSQIWDTILANTELRAEIARLIGQPEVASNLPRLVADSAIQEPLLRILSHPAFHAIADRTLPRALAPEQAATLLNQPDTREPALTLLNRPAFQDLSIRTLPRIPDLAPLARTESGRLMIAQAMNRSAELSQQMIARLAQSPELPAGTAALFSRPDALPHLARILDSPGITAAAQALSLLARPEMEALIRPVFANPAAASRIAEWIAAPPTRPATLQILQSPAMAPVASDILNRPEVREALLGLLRSTSERPQALQWIAETPPHMRLDMASVLTRFLASPEGRAAVDAMLNAAIAQNTYAPEIQSFFQLAQWPEISPPFQQLLANPESSAMLQQMIGNPTLRPDTLQFLAASSLAPINPTIFAAPSLQYLLSVPFSETESSLKQAEMAAILKILAQPGMRSLLPMELQTPGITPGLLRLLSEPQTRSLALQILLQHPTIPAAESLFRSESGQAIWTRLLNSSEVRVLVNQNLATGNAQAQIFEALAQPGLAAYAAPMLAHEGIRHRIPQFLQDETIRPALLRLLAQPGMEQAVARIFARGDTLPILERLLANQPIDPALLRILSQPSMQPLVREILGRMHSTGPSAASREQLLQLLPAFSTDEPNPLWLLATSAYGLNRNPEPVHAPPLPALLSAKGIPSDTIDALHDALQRLGRISPERARQALLTLNAVAQLGARNLHGILDQITTRLDTISQALALKGGLPPSQYEPLLPPGLTLLMLRITGLPQESLVGLARSLADAGLNLAFVGRDSIGNAQIHIQTIETSLPGSSAFPPILYAGLRPTEAARLAQAFPTRDIAPSPTQSPSTAIDPPGANRATAPTLAESLATAMQAARATTANPMPGTQGFLFSYHLAIIFPWMPTAMPDGMENLRANREQASIEEEEEEYIPTFLDLIALQPLMLPYYPDELMIPGTNIPLILPPEADIISITENDAEGFPSAPSL